MNVALGCRLDLGPIDAIGRGQRLAEDVGAADDHDLVRAARRGQDARQRQRTG